MATPGVEIREQTPYYGYIYMWCDHVKNKYYIGSHKGSIFDKYKSGSKWVNSIIKKRPNDISMRILEYYYGDNRENLYKLETKWLRFYNVENNKVFYNFKNVAVGGCGAFKHKGKKRSEYTPNWVDHRKGKKLEEIYKNPEQVRERLAQTQKNHIEKHGHGTKKGIKHINGDKRKGKTVEEIYGYRRLVNPPKPFNITVCEPGKDSYDIFCQNIDAFFKLLKLETYTFQILKNKGVKTILRTQPSTRHNFSIGTVLYLKYVVDEN